MTEEMDIELIVRQRLAEHLAAPWSGPEAERLNAVIASFGALPLLVDMGGVFALRGDGEIISYLWDVPHRLEVVADPRMRNIALYQGSLRYGELKSLVPARPSDAQDCTYCGGTGNAPIALELNLDNILCYCGGLGWLPRPSAAEGA